MRDSYRLPDNDNQAYFAMADAVCVPVIEFLAQHVLAPVLAVESQRPYSGKA